MLYGASIEPDADCERRDGWFLEQDVNAWSSLAYVAAGAVVAIVVARRRLPPVMHVLAALLVLEGVGSFAYHGASGDLAWFLHDVPLLAMLGFVAGWHAGRVVGRAAAGAVAIALASGVIGGALWLVDHSVTNVIAAVLVVGVVAAELVARRRGMSGVWNAGLLALLALAVLGWLAGASGSPVCDGDSWVQPHGWWHVTTALVAVVWADRASGALDPLGGARLVRHAIDRSLGLLARGLVLAFHRSVDVVGRDRMPPRGRPVLVVANHGNGFVDPLVVASVLGRLPRFLAKAALWKVPIARPFLAFAGVLPVYRSADGDRTADNRSVFEACHHELERGQVVGIFPEGTTGDRAALDRVRSGAARIALGALSTAPDLVVVPIGLAFESRVRTRTRAVVMFGEPLAVTAFATPRPAGGATGPPAVDGEARTAAADGDAEPDRADVARLTAAITAALESVSPQFASVHEREVLRAAARVERTEAAGGRPASFGAAEAVARRAAAAPAAARERIVEMYRRYATGLQLVGLRDDQLRPATGSTGRLVLSVAALVLAGSFVLAATLVHLPAMLLVVACTGFVRSTATKGTVRMLVGLVAGIATWIVVGVVVADGVAALAVAALTAVSGAIALAVWSPLTRQATAWWGRVRVRDRIGLVPPVLADRDALVAAVRDATAAGPGAPTAPATREREVRA